MFRKTGLEKTASIVLRWRLFIDLMIAEYAIKIKFKTITLGKTGFDLTEIGFGAWAIGGRRYGPVAESDGIKAIHAYVQGGGNFIDTARSYGSEPLLGQYFAQHGGRDKIFIATKAPSVEPEDIRNDLETSLRELQTDYIDLYYLHRPPEDPDHMNRLLDLYDQLKTEGKIRATGASNRPLPAIHPHRAS